MGGTSPRRELLRRWRRAAAVGIVVVGLPSVPLAWRGWAAARLSAGLARLRAAGEPVTPADFPADPVSDADNASLDYEAAGRLIDVSRPAWQQWESEATGSSSRPSSPAACDTWRQIVADNAGALARVDAARGKAAGPWHDPFVLPTIYTSRQFDVQPAQDLASLLGLAARLAQAQGDGATAVARASDLCHLSDAAERRPFSLGHLVAGGIWSLTARTVEQIAPTLTVGGPRGADRAAVGRLVTQLLDGRAAAAGDCFAWRTERILIVRVSREAASPTGVFQAIATHDFRTAGTTYLLAPIVLTDARHLSDEMQQVIRAGQAADLPTAAALMPTTMRATIDANPAWHPVADGWIPTLVTIARPFETLTRRRLSAVAIALRLYQLEHGGRLPVALADLVPGELAAVPVDPMSGRSFLYLPTGPDPRIYSVGPNGVDNGGLERNPQLANMQQEEIDDIVLHLDPSATPTVKPE